ncbi:sulfotransferase [Pelagibacterales bacterium SAG-MED41]|nr:sulfotransferase [Pelagibacterales bacterium SAG-MED41]
MDNKDVLFVNIMGVGKNGTTLLGSLLDNHNELSSFPMEMKFVEHFLHNVKRKNFLGLENFLFNKSKLILLNKNKANSLIQDESERIVTGNLSQIDFDLAKFKKIFKDNINFDLEEKNLEKILKYFHLVLEKYLSKKFNDKVIIQDGAFGLRLIKDQINLFKNIKFLIIVRNPLDTYVSMKKIIKNFKYFRRFIGDFGVPEQKHIKNEEINYKIINKIFSHYKNDKRFLFLKYEDLVENPQKIMIKLSDFLQIKYSESMLKPSVFGQDWYGNSTRVKKKKSIDAKEVGKYFSNLNKNEINFIELSHKKFYKNFSYLENIKSFSLISSVKIIFKIYIQNLLEAREVIPKKNFIVKYLYFTLILNNYFLIRNLFHIEFSNEK